MDTPQTELNFISQFSFSPPSPCPVISILAYDTTIHIVTQTEYTGVSQESSILFTANI